MPNQLDEVEARILGSLVEKSLTTPELYPLTLNALVNACNQKSSREPIMSLDYGAVQRSLETLIGKGYAARRYEPGGRSERFGHRIEVLLGTEDAKIIGLVCALLLRGAQTVGELKTRTERLCAFADLADVDRLLQELSARVDGPIVARLPRQPGQKETRWRQLFTASAAAPAPSAAAEPAAAPTAKPPDRLGQLEKRVESLEARLAALEDLSKG